MSRPFISGFTLVKNGLSLGYPVVESIKSIEPLCDEVAINIGFDSPEKNKDDGTEEYLQDHFRGKKFRFIRSYWNLADSKGGVVLAKQTDRALRECRGKYCQYIQADEVLHEDGLASIHRGAMEMERRREIEGLIFDYLHFYGGPHVIKNGHLSYRREIRFVRNFCGISSWRDAQGFRKDSEKIVVKQSKAVIYHYGWAREEKVMSRKIRSFEKLYHGHDHESRPFHYEHFWGLRAFAGSHPHVMKQWIKNHENKEILSLPIKRQWKDIRLAASTALEKLTGLRPFEYKNFIEVT